MPVQFEAVPGYGVLLHAQVNAAGEGAPIVLMGHMDTVFPAMARSPSDLTARKPGAPTALAWPT